MKARGSQPATRMLILEAALTLLSVHGFSGATLGNLARQVGMSKSGLFAHFKSVGEVHLALIAHANEVFQARVILRTAASLDGLPRLRQTAVAWLQETSQPGPAGGDPLLAALFEFDDREGPVRSALFVKENAWRDHLALLVRAASDRALLIKELDVQRIVSEICGICYNFHVAERFLRKAGAYDAAVEAVDALFLRTLPRG